MVQKITVIALLSLCVCGCTHVRPTYLADGHRGYFLKCGWRNSWPSCLAKAGKLCGNRGYSLAMSDEFERAMIVGCNSVAPADSSLPRLSER